MYSIGVDLGGTKVLTAVVNKQTGEVVSYIKKKTKKHKGINKLIQKIINSINDVIQQSGVSIDMIDEIGIGAAGQINRQNGVIINAPNLDCKDLNIKTVLEDEFKKTVYVANDVEIATLGEMKFGSGRGCDDYVCVFVGTGIGSGIVQNGKIRIGASGTAGEIGHIIVDVGGRPCSCGGYGCLEAYASRLAVEKKITGNLKKGRTSDIVNYMSEGKPVKTSMIRKALANNDELILQILDEAAEYLACGLASIINFYNPKMIVLGGGLIDGVDYFYEQTIRLAKSKSLPIPSKSIIFRKAELGDYSGVVGAAILADYRKVNLT